MRIGFLITARLKSNRLKLKLLLPLNGYSVIERVIHRAKAVIECDDVVLCTSKLSQDLPLVRTAQGNDIFYFTGDPEDVLQRLLDTSLFFGLDYFVGITADNPLFSIYHANMLVDIVRRDPSIDFVYTLGMPIGVNVYAMNVKALEVVCAVKKQVDTEIWGYLIKRPEIFNVRELNVNKEFMRDEYRLTLDEFDDYVLFKNLYNKLRKDEVPALLDAYEVLDLNPKISKINQHVVQLDLDENIKQSIDEYYKKNREQILGIKNNIYFGNA